MKICLVCHQYLPLHRAGVEIYTHRMARLLQEAGHEVLVFAAQKDLSRAEGELIETEFEGVRNLRLIRNFFYRDFRETFADPLPGRRFEEGVLERFAPDIVHVHHLMHLGLDLPARVRAHGIPVLMTLHDYWLACPRYGHLRDAWGELCAVVDLERCARCMGHFDWRNPPGLRPVARGLRLVRKLSGLDLQVPLQALYRRARTRVRTRSRRKSREKICEGGTAMGSRPPEGAQQGAPQQGAEQESFRRALEERRHQVFEILVPAVERFLCPSLFLRDWMRQQGFPESKLVFQPTGVPLPEETLPEETLPEETLPEEALPEEALSGEGSRGGFATEPGPPRRPLRAAFLGSVLPHKGVHLILDAYELLQQRGVSLELAIHGGSGPDPSYGGALRRRAEALGVGFTGSYLPSRIEALLRGVDLLIVPSLWFENRPFTILDARVRGIPSLVTDLGGLAELMPDPRLRFALGDSRDLALRLEQLATQGLAGLDLGPWPPSPQEDLEKTLEEYRALCR